MVGNSGNSDMELAAPDAALEEFLDAEPLVYVDSLDYRQRRTY